MKKILVIILTNIILLFVVYFVFTYLLQSRYIDEKLRSFQQTHVKVDISDIETMEIPNGLNMIPLTEESMNDFCGEQRVEINKDFSKEPIITMGCSYVYGHGIKKEESFPYLLSELTNRPVYNFSSCGGDLVSSTNELYENLKTEQAERLKQAKYIIYIYMHDHINRYILPDKEKAYDKSFTQGLDFKTFLNRFYFIRNLKFRMKLYSIYKQFPYSQNAEVYLKKILSNNIKVLKEKIPNAKIIFIIYDELPILMQGDYTQEQIIRFETDVIKSNIWKELEEQEGIKVVHTKNLVGFSFGEDYILLDDIAPYHPNAKVWELFTPLFVKEYIKE